jgi:hypothetical protein
MWVLPDLAYIYAVAGKQSKSRALLEDALKLSDERQSNNWNLVAIYASISDADRTFQWLRLWFSLTGGRNSDMLFRECGGSPHAIEP